MLHINAEKTNGKRRGRRFIPAALAAVMMVSGAGSALSASADVFSFNDTGSLFDIPSDLFIWDLEDNKADFFYNGHEVIETTYHTGASDFKFMYSDGIFEDDPVQYSPHMATLACSMGHASCTHVENKSYENGAKNITALLENAGFTDIYVSDSYTKKPTADSIACVIAGKMVHTKDGDKKVIAIAVRSGGYESEWASNVKLGTSGEAEGFSSAADQVVGKSGFALNFDDDEGKSYLRDYFEIYGKDDLENGNVIFWLNGFSKGGATANLSAKRLIDATQGSGNSVVAYCIEAPQGGVASEENPDCDYRTIHNVINEDDFVAYVAPSSIGFKRYGVDHYVQRGEAHSDRIIEAGTNPISYFPNNASDNIDTVVDLNRQLKRMKFQLSEMVGDDASKFYPYTYEMYKYTLENFTEIQKVGKGTTTTAKYLQGFMNSVAVDERFGKDGVTRAEYATMQAEIADVVSYIMNDGDISALTEYDFGFTNTSEIILRSLWTVYKDPVRLARSVTVVGDKIYIDIDGSLKRDLVNQVGQTLRVNRDFMQKMKDYPGGPNKAIEAIQKLADQILGGRKDLNQLITFGENADGIEANHQFETTSAWLRSFDDWYDCYYSEEFIENSVDTLPDDIGVLIDLNASGRKNIKSATVKIFGKTATGEINRHGEYELSEETLLDEVTINTKGRAKTKIPKGIVPESIRFVLTYDDGITSDNGGECTGAELINNARECAPDLSYKNISDVEIAFDYFEPNGYGPPRNAGEYVSLYMGFKNTSYGNFSTSIRFDKN